MMELVNMLVEQGCVEELMSCGSYRARRVNQKFLDEAGWTQKKVRTEVVEHVLEDKEEGELWEHSLP